MKSRPALVIAGTDTDVGKTVFAAGLVGALDADYWKPVQSGLAGATDSETVARLSARPGRLGSILPEAYRFALPASPHRAAEAEDREIDVSRLDINTLPPGDAPLVVELAGGLLVPLTRHILQIDLLARWQLPVVLVARTALGTINHSLLSIEALRARDIALVGVAFVGEADNLDAEMTICQFAGLKRLGRLPLIAPLTPETLAASFAANFKAEDFLKDIP